MYMEDIFLPQGFPGGFAHKSTHASFIVTESPIADAIASVKGVVKHWEDYLAHALGLYQPDSAAPPQSSVEVQIPRLVAYLSKSCPHCIDLQPAWVEARKRSAMDATVKWEEKECFGEGYAMGKDLDECGNDPDVYQYPTIKYFSGSKDRDGTVFFGARTPENLLNFLKIARGESYNPIVHDAAGMEDLIKVDPIRIVSYSSKSCGKRCDDLSATWQQAAARWSEDHGTEAFGDVTWEQKDCTGAEGGGLSNECLQDGVEMFPAVKIYGGNAHALGDELPGRPTVASLINFVEEHRGPLPKKANSCDVTHPQGRDTPPALVAGLDELVHLQDLETQPATHPPPEGATAPPVADIDATSPVHAGVSPFLLAFAALSSDRRRFKVAAASRFM